MIGDEIDLLIIYCQLDPFCRANTKERPRRRPLEGELTTKKCVQIGHATRFGIDRGRKKDPFCAFIRWEEVDSWIAPAKPG